MDFMSSNRRLVLMAIVIGLTIAVAVLELTNNRTTVSNGLRGSHAQLDRESLKKQLLYVEGAQNALAAKLKITEEELGAANEETEDLLNEIEDIEEDAQGVIDELEAEIEEEETELDQKDKLLDEIETVVENDEAEIEALQQENTDLGHELDSVEEEYEAAEEDVVKASRVRVCLYVCVVASIYSVEVALPARGCSSVL